MIHRNLSRCVGFALAAAICVAGTATAATLLAGKGSISGTVKTEAGAPAVGLVIKLEQEIPLTAGTRGGTKGKGKSGFGDTGATDLQGNKQQRKKIIGQMATDQTGRFSFTNIEEGAYRLVAGNRSQGWIYRDVEIKANENTDLGELKLVKPK